MLRDIGLDPRSIGGVNREVRTLPVPTRQLIEIAKGWGRAPQAADPRRADLRARPRRGGAWCSASPGRLAERSGTVLFIGHRLDEVRAVSDRILVLRNGKLVADLTRPKPPKRGSSARWWAARSSRPQPPPHSG